VSLTPLQCVEFADLCINLANSLKQKKTGPLHRMAKAWLELADELLERHNARAIYRDRTAANNNKIQ